MVILVELTAVDVSGIGYFGAEVQSELFPAFVCQTLSERRIQCASLVKW
jgi:hypothetical protein